MILKDRQKAEIIAKGIIAYLRKNKNENLLDLVVDALERRALRDNYALVTSALALTEKEKEKAKKLVEKLLNGKEAKIKFGEDASILDGIQVSYRDQIWDLSLAGQLQQFLKNK